jgi:putative transcriptional regulator
MNKSKSNVKEQAAPSYLDGQLLIAMPSMKDPRFERAVILMCAHSEDGAMGIILNQPTPEISFADLLDQLEIDDEEELTPLEGDLAIKPVHVGGPVETSRGFVLHSSDYNADDSTLPIKSGICLTATIEILRAIAQNKGPKQSFLALGYAGWAPGQLENELLSNGWLNCAVDLDLIFENGLDDKYDQALALLGIDASFLVSDAGHA